MKKVRLLALDVIDGKGFSEVRCGELQDYYDALKCDCFDVTSRKIGGKTFDIFCDDVGLFEERPIPSAIYDDMNVGLVGNLIFAHHDNEGNTTELSDNDIFCIMDNAVMMAERDGNKKWIAVMLDK